MENQEVKEVTTLALSVPEQARQIKVVDADSYRRAGEVIVYIKALRKKIADTFKPIKRKIDESKREALDQERAADLPLKEAENYLSPQIIAYGREQERIRREEESRLREIARKQEEERRMQEALEAEAQGETETANAIINEPAYIPPVVVAKTLPKVAGMSIQGNWTFRIVNPNIVQREYWKVDEAKIGGVVRSLKDQCRIPGIEVYKESTVAGRRVA